jgi:hypothetical protein
MKNITRTIKTYITDVQAVKFEDGDVVSRPIEPVITVKKLNKKQIEKECEEFLEDGESLVIKETLVEENLYKMPLDHFMRMAVIDNGAEEEEDA